MSEYIFELDNLKLVYEPMQREEIVRCRDCTAYDGEGYGCSYGRGDDPDGFCSWGVRRDS